MIEYNIYCDESCHLLNDTSDTMVLGAIWCSKEDKKYIFDRIKEIKIKHKLKSSFEIKWHKVSLSKYLFYKELVNFFFDTDKLNFRAIVIPNKSRLDHDKYNQSHDDFYYKMYFDMLKIIITPHDVYNIYLDLKDTKGYEKVNQLHQVISSEKYDFSKKIIKKIQEVRSDEVSILQLADLLIGSLSYVHRHLDSSQAKLKLIDIIKRRTNYSLIRSTLPTERKFNVFIWQPDFKRGG